MADPLARISSMLESARELTVEAAVSASTRLSETPTAKRPQEISKLLNSRTEREVLNGMKCVMALIARDEDGTPYFADVVKNVTLTNPRVRALVLIYLQKYAENEPDTALLLINSIQKALGDKKPNARAASIRTLGGIRIPEIASLLVLCIKRTASDSLPQVRAATALAIGKAYEIEGINNVQLTQHLYGLLSDLSPVVVGAAIKVYYKLKPQLEKLLAKRAWAPIHANFRRYTRIIADLDEWSTSFLIDILSEYARRFLPRPTLVRKDGSSMPLPETFAEFPASYTLEMDSDVEMFIKCLAPLSSASDIIILSAIKGLTVVGTPEHIEEFGFASVLIKIATRLSSLPSKLCALEVVLMLALAFPRLFEKSYPKFFLFPQDTLEVATVKLTILLAVFSDSSARSILRELQYGAINYRPEIARVAVRVLDMCSQKSIQWSNKVLKWCLHNLEKSSATSIVSELLTVIRHLLQQRQASEGNQQELVRTIYKLSLLLNDSNIYLDVGAKATIIWIIGEFTAACENLIGPDVLRHSIKLFPAEDEKVRYELLVLAAKSYLFEMLRGTVADVENSRLGQIFRHIMHLSRYDSSFDTRDRVRMWDELLVKSANHQLASLFLEVPKPTPISPTSKHIFHQGLSMYYDVIPWADQSTLPPKSIRKEVEKPENVTHVESGITFGKLAHTPTTHAISSELVNRQTIAAASKYKLQSLDEFFANDDSEESDQSEDGDEEENDDEDSEEGNSLDDTSSFEESSGSESEHSNEGEGDSDASQEASPEKNNLSSYERDDASSTHSRDSFL